MAINLPFRDSKEESRFEKWVKYNFFRSRLSEKERKRLEAEAKKYREEQERKRKEFEEKIFAPQPKAIQKIQDWFETKVIQPVERDVKRYEAEKAPLEKKAEKIPEEFKGMFPITRVPELVRKAPGFATKMFLGTPEERAEIARIERKGTTEERKKLSYERAMHMAFAVAITSGAPKAGPMNTSTARQILKVKKGATEVEIKSAYRVTAKAKYPRTLEDLAKRYNTNVARILNDAKNILLREAKLFRPQVAKLPEGKPVQTALEKEKVSLAETKRLFERKAAEKVKVATGKELEGLPMGEVVELEKHAGGLFVKPTVAVKPKVEKLDRKELLEKLEAKGIKGTYFEELPLAELREEVAKEIEAPELKTTLDEIKSAIFSGDLKSARSLYKSISEEKPTFSTLLAEIEKEQKITIGEARVEPEERLVRTGTEATKETIRKFKGFLRIAGEKVSKKTGLLFREHIPESVFGVSSDEVASSLGKTENEFMADLTKDIDIVGKAPTLSIIRSARGKIAKIKSTAEALKLDPEFYKVVETLDTQLKTIPSYKRLKPYKTIGGVSVKPTPVTLEKIKEKETKAVKKRQEQLVKGEIGELRQVAKNIGTISVMGKPPAEQARVAGKLMGQATAEGIDVAIAKPYNRSAGATIRAVFTDSLRDYIGRQGEAGKTLSETMLLARRRGDSWAGDAIADLEPLLDALTEAEAAKFADLREKGLPGTTPTLNAVLEAWSRLSNKVFAHAKRAGLDIGYQANYFPHFIPEELIISAKGRKAGLKKMVQEGHAKNIAEAEVILNQYNLRTTYRRYGHLEKAREADFPIYEKDPRKVLISYLDGAWHRIADAEYFGPKDEKAYELADKIGMEGGDVKTTKDMLNMSFGKTVHPEVYKILESKVGAWQIITKFTPMTSLANLSQRLEVLAWVGPKAWTKPALKSLLGKRFVSPEEKEWATRTGVLFDTSKKQFLKDFQESGKIKNLSENLAIRYLRLIKFSPIEDVNRIFTANVGKDFIKDIFKKYLKKPEKKALERTLERFGVDYELARMNGKLSKQDLINASQFLNDVTQYPYKTEELPSLLNAHPITRMLTRWKSFAYFSAKNKLKLGKIMWKEAKHGNFSVLVSTLLAYGIGYQIVGEIMNDLWAKIRQDPRDEEGFARLVDNYLWIGSFFTDLIQATRYGKSGIFSFFTGPDISTAVNLVDVVASLARDRKTKEGVGEIKARVKPGAKFLLREVPIIGPALPPMFEGLFEEKKKGSDFIKEMEKKYGPKKEEESDFVKEMEKKYGTP